MKPLITYEDFAKMDIRMGTILSAERVPETDKLLKCTIDFGELGTRVIVSGIAEHYTPEDLVGKQCPYVVNLTPREIRGIESEGMLLAVPDDGIALLHSNKKVSSGAKIG